MKQDIAKRIKDIRMEKGMTQEELAVLCGYKSRSAINKIEAGTRNFSIETAKKIAKALNVDPDYLVFGDEDVKEEINRLFDLLPADKQEAVLAFLRSMLGDRAKV